MSVITTLAFPFEILEIADNMAGANKRVSLGDM